MLKISDLKIISAYQSICLIFSMLVKNNIPIIKKEKLVETLWEVSRLSETHCLFEDIGFRVYFDSVCSLDIENSLCQLFTFGAISSISPENSVIIIHFSSKDVENQIKYCLKEYGEDYIKAAEIVAQKVGEVCK